MKYELYRTDRSRLVVDVGETTATVHLAWYEDGVNKTVEYTETTPVKVYQDWAAQEPTAETKIVASLPPAKLTK